MSLLWSHLLKVWFYNIVEGLQITVIPPMDLITTPSIYNHYETLIRKQNYVIKHKKVDSNPIQ